MKLVVDDFGPTARSPLATAERSAARWALAATYGEPEA